MAGRRGSRRLREAATIPQRRPARRPGEWEHVDGEWRPRYEVVSPDDADAVRVEIARQIEQFTRIVGKPPNHLDSHQHVHRTEPVRRLLARAGRRLGVPVRDVTPGITYNGAFHGQDGRGSPMAEAISVDALVTIIEDLPPGVTELGCHPGTDYDLDTMYAAERIQEVATLCDPRVRNALDACGVELCSFADLDAA